MRDGTIRILPERWEAVYVNWLENIRDWNISRQLWWGHRIPVWYCDECDKQIVSRTDVTRLRQMRRSRAAGRGRARHLVLVVALADLDARLARQELGGSRAFYPTDVLVTAPEILFFWVARMIMAGYAFMDAPPFHTVYLHGTVRDAEHARCPSRSATASIRSTSSSSTAPTRCATP